MQSYVAISNVYATHRNAVSKICPEFSSLTGEIFVQAAPLRHVRKHLGRTVDERVAETEGEADVMDYVLYYRGKIDFSGK